MLQLASNLLRVVFKVAIFFMVLLIFFATALALNDKLLQIKINRLNKEITKEYEELQKLRAEWNYVNNKEYLQMLVDKYMPEMNQEIRRNTVEKLR